MHERTSAENEMKMVFAGIKTVLKQSFVLFVFLSGSKPLT